MNIGILTYYGVHNHGAVLQANALKSVLEEMGHNVEFLTFERDYSYISQEQTKKYNISLKSVPYYIRYTAEKGVGNIIYNLKKRNTLNEFKKNNFKFFEKYSNFNGDVTIVGSDEVFSLEIGYNPMMYGYNVHSKRLISYAASFGPTTTDEVNNKHKSEIIREGLSNFSNISVRDENSKKIIKDVCGTDATIVCDPVILYGYEKEMNFFKPNHKDYIVVYSYDSRMNDPEEVSIIRAYAKKNNLKVYSVGYYHKWCDRNINATPIELIGWIKNAELTITDTFHGSVISLICNTPMAVKLRGNTNKLAYLLDEYSLSSRIMVDFNNLESVASTAVDFEEVNQVLQRKQRESMLYLRNALEVN